MGIHAKPSADAEQRLKEQRKRETISSLIISFLSITLIGLVLGLVFLPKITDTQEVMVVYKYEQEKEKKPEPIPKPTVIKKPTPPSSSSSVAKVITSVNTADFVVPIVDIDTETPNLEFGESADFGSGWNTGIGSNPFSSIPSTMRKRCSPQERMKRLKESGGDPKSEKAVVAALDWLQETQNADGSWGNQHKSAMTGFAILAFLGHCETPSSKKYGKTVERGMVWLVDLGLKNDGRLSQLPEKNIQWVYEQGISTYALAESLTLSKDMKYNIPKLDEVTKKAGEMIMDGQAGSGGWNYRYSPHSSEGDNSVGFWQIQALKACKHTKLWPDSKFKPTAREAMKFLKKVQGQNGAIGYRTDHNRSPHLTGGGVLCMQFWGEGDSDEAEKGIKWIRENSTFEWGKTSSNLYYHYYNAQAMINAGGEDWEWYNNMFQKQLLDAQNDDGSWTQKMAHGPINQHMATCLATFMLEVYYRFLPASK
ncbi:terpene cyclase/mutase family protein [bacterium]|nr:terpene cyclase/mutase family protein [bacterium]